MSQAVALGRRHRASFARILPFALYIGFLAVMPLIVDALPDVDSRWLYAVQISAVVFALAFFARHYVELRFVQPLSATQWLVGLATGLAVFILWISLDLPWMKLGAGGTAGFDPRDAAGAVIWPLALVRVLGAALVVPIMEELFWRSFVMRWIDRSAFLSVAPAMVSLRALAISSLVFGVEHDLWFAGIVAGLAYGWLYMRSGNLWSPILAHGVTNLLLGIWVLNTGNWQFW
jgi:CAAX prenyl protease-like protein